MDRADERPAAPQSGGDRLFATRGQLARMVEALSRDLDDLRQVAGC